MIFGTTVDAASASSGVQAVLGLGGFVFTVLGTIASIVALVLGFVWAPRRSNEQPVVGKKVPTVRFWRPRNYNLALGHLRDFIRRWQDRQFSTDNKRGYVTEYDLVRWIIQLALTCAANVIPQSLGKANLLRVSRIERDSDDRVRNVTVYSSEFDGIFTAEQLVNDLNPRRMRDLSLVQSGSGHRDYPAALQCIVDRRPIIQSLRQRSSHFDTPELHVGLSHVLAIPLRMDFSSALPDQPVSITVDLHYSRLVGYLVDKFGLHRRTLLRRAAQLSALLMQVSAIHATAFLPPSDIGSVPEEPGPSASNDDEGAHPTAPMAGTEGAGGDVTDTAGSERDEGPPPGHFL